MTVRRVVMASLVVPLLGLSACGKDPVEPAPFSPSPSVAQSSPTASPTGPAEPTMPAAAEGDSRAAAKAFVRYYFHVMTYSMQTGDTKQVGGLATDGCRTCSSVVKKIHHIYAPGGRLQTRGWSVAKMHAVSRGDADHTSFYVRMNQARSRLFNENGKFIDREAAQVVPMLIRLGRSGSQWQVERLDVIG
jgi:hypothetical protein